MCVLVSVLGVCLWVWVSVCVYSCIHISVCMYVCVFLVEGVFMFVSLYMSLCWSFCVSVCVRLRECVSVWQREAMRIAETAYPTCKNMLKWLLLIRPFISKPKYPWEINYLRKYLKFWQKSKAMALATELPIKNVYSFWEILLAKSPFQG